MHDTESSRAATTHDDLEDLRLAVYRSFAAHGAVGSAADVASLVHQPESSVRADLRRLAAARHVVLDDDDRILMAHPFASIPLGFSVMGEHALWWGGCAWDSFAIAHLLPDEPEVLVATTCPHCVRPHAWVVTRERPPDGNQIAHFLVPVARMWDDVVHSCAHQRVFCSTDCVEAWLRDSGNVLGYTMDLTTLWRLAQRWYEGRLDCGYTRRDPMTAAAYFRDVGLTGPFWGL